MFPKLRIPIIVISLALLALACGQLEIGVESAAEEPSPVPPTKTVTMENLSGNNKQTMDKNPTPTNTEVATNTEVSTPLPEAEAARLDCSEFGSNALTTLACNVEASFVSRNTQALLGYMPAEFAYGFWQSEWMTVTPEYALQSFQNSILPPDPGKMTFTIDRDQFPPLFGMPVDGMLGPDVEIALVIYSEGWGEEGTGAALIFITGNETSGYQFPAFLIAGGHFDKPEAGRLDCSDFGANSLTTIACNIQDSLISRNTSAIVNYLSSEFALGYWLSEWTTVTPEYALEFIQNYMLPHDPDQLTFTSDPDQFPDIGRPIETMLGPDDEVALVIYSEGWNEEGSAIFFITGNETSGYQFRAMLVGGNHFEMPSTPNPGD
jgi:hypothetical protein